MTQSPTANQAMLPALPVRLQSMGSCKLRCTLCSAEGCHSPADAGRHCTCTKPTVFLIPHPMSPDLGVSWVTGHASAIGCSATGGFRQGCAPSAPARGPCYGTLCTASPSARPWRAAADLARPGLGAALPGRGPAVGTATSPGRPCVNTRAGCRPGWLRGSTLAAVTWVLVESRRAAVPSVSVTVA